ncbi:MAG: SelL-related redox protein [Saprospiraceae bacterium]
MINKLNLQQIHTNKGNDLLELSGQHPVLLVFLRHFGCVYCKESMKDIAKKRVNLENRGIHIVMVHMADNEVAEDYFKGFALEDIEHISDKDCKVYALFGLMKGSFSQLLGLKTWIRGFELAVAHQMFPSNQRVGDGHQMPGVFLLDKGEVKNSFVHHSVADKPDYEELIRQCEI